MLSRVAFVTGGSRGIGREIALTLCRAGFAVVVASPELERNEEVAERIRECSGQALTLNLDLMSLESIQASFEQVKKVYGRIDVLVNNAGITKDALAPRMKADDWQKVLQIDLNGAFYCIQQALPAMIAQKWGRIINIASVVGEMGNAGQANYSAAKAGLIGLTKALAHELAENDITVNAVAPGYIETDMTAGLPAEVKQKLQSLIPLRRLGKPRDIAAAVRFLASEDASYITGHVLDVNGGMHM
ncbi:MAG: 3-oxoacyl-[acyl-carrier-protein] reductase [Acidobacteria bacterium]|nr:3-oxoacyl-[acyl-carrier-protein] reductase [Acidobacteriota bacterium]